jgi:hypothetical protein
VITLLALANAAERIEHISIAPTVPNASQFRMGDGIDHLTKLLLIGRLLTDVTVIRLIPREKFRRVCLGHTARGAAPVNNVEGAHNVQAMNSFRSHVSLANVPPFSCGRISKRKRSRWRRPSPW